MHDPLHPARATWEVIEPIHAVTYFADEAAAAFADAGARGFWMGYFGGRAAPFGEATPALVEATFFGFPRAQVARAVPDVWRFSSPRRMLDARVAGADAALARLGVTDAEVEPLVDRLREAVAAAGVAGRPLFAANSELDWPLEPRGALWHATTLLREHRGDGHVAALTAAGIDGCASHVLAAARSATTVDVQRRARYWDDDAWAGAVARLTERGWLDGGELAYEGMAAAGEVERRTDELALALDPALLDELRPLARKVLTSGVVPFPNAIALPRPAWLDG